MKDAQLQQKIQSLTHNITTPLTPPQTVDQTYKLVKIMDVFDGDEIVLDGERFYSDLNAYDEVTYNFGESGFTALYFDHDLIWDGDLDVLEMARSYPELVDSDAYDSICGLLVKGNLKVTGQLKVDGSFLFVSGDATVKSFWGNSSIYAAQVSGKLTAREFIWSSYDAATLCGGEAFAPIFVNETELYSSMYPHQDNLINYDIRDRDDDFDSDAFQAKLQPYLLDGPEDSPYISWGKVINAYRLGLPIYK